MNSQTSCITRFLREELAIPGDIIPRILEQSKKPSRLPVILWQERLVNLTQLDLLITWLERYLTETI